MRIKKFLILCFMICAFTSCKKHTKIEEPLTNDASLATIILNKELKVGVNTAIPPLCFYSSEGKIVGYEIDIAERIAHTLGVKLTILPVSIYDRKQKLNYNSIDYIAGGFIDNSDNRKKFSLTLPYLRDAIVLIIPHSTGKTAPTKLADLKQKHIGCISERNITDPLVNSPLYQQNHCLLKTAPSLKEVLNNLDSGKIDAAAINLLTYYNKITKEQKSYEVIDEPVVVNLYSYAFRQEDIQLRNAVNEILQDLAENGTLATISRKWFGADVSIIGQY